MTIPASGRLFEALARWWDGKHVADCAHVLAESEQPRAAWLCDRRLWCLFCVNTVIRNETAPVPTACDICGSELPEHHGGAIFAVANLSIFIAACAACERNEP